MLTGQDRIQEAMRLEAARRHGRGYDELTGLEIVHLTTDAYLDLFAKPTPDQRALLVMWGSTFAEHASVDGMSEAERRSYDGFAEVIEKGQRDGTIRGDINPISSAVLLLGLIRGVAALLLTDSGLVDMRSVRITCRTLVESGLPRPELESGRRHRFAVRRRPAAARHRPRRRSPQVGRALARQL